MNSETTKWQFKDEYCPCSCGGHGELCFATCPGCGLVVLICEELGTVYAGIRQRPLKPYGHEWVDDCMCPRCRRVALGAFDYSTSEEIRGAGIKKSEYVRYPGNVVSPTGKGEG